MKSLYSPLILAITAVLCLGSVGLAEDRIAFIDMERVFSEYTRTRTAEERLKRQADQFREQTEARMEEMQALEEAFAQARQEAQDMALSEEVRRQRRADAEEKLLDLRRKEEEVRTFTEQRRRELESTSQRLREGIVEEINIVLREFARERDFLAVLDSSGNSFNQIPVVLYQREGLDITSLVLDQLNADARRAAPAALPE